VSRPRTRLPAGSSCARSARRGRSRWSPTAGSRTSSAAPASAGAPAAATRARAAPAASSAPRAGGGSPANGGARRHTCATTTTSSCPTAASTAATATGPRSNGSWTVSMTDYVELRCRSAFSFLAGASLPEDLVERAAALGIDTVALADRSGLYAAPRFFLAARKPGVRPLVGAEVMIEGAGLVWLLVESRAGYRRLCRLLTDAALGRAKGTAAARWEQLEEHAGGLFCLAGGAEGPL